MRWLNKIARRESLFFSIQMAFAIGVRGESRSQEKKQKVGTVHSIVPYDPRREPIYRFDRYPWLLTNPKSNVALLAIVQAVDPITKHAYKNIVPILAFLKKQFRQHKNLYPHRIRYPGTVEQNMEAISEAIRHAKQNQRRLMAFRALAHKWLLKRRFKAGNEEDLVTGEAPKKLVTLVVWSERRIYSFEANTIRRDMLERLFQHSYLFPKYLPPRNPYTNCEMTSVQLSSVISQLRAFGLSHWAFEGLLKCKYDMDKFKAMFGEAVKRELIAKHFNNLSSPETIDIVIDFIDDQHDENAKYFDIALYRWAFDNNVRHSKISKWVAVCRDYHEALLNIRDRHDLGKKILEIRATCLKLCSYPFDLQELRNMQRKKQGLPPIVLAASQPQPQPQPAAEVENVVYQLTTVTVDIADLDLSFVHLYGDSEITITGGDETPSTEAETP